MREGEAKVDLYNVRGVAAVKEATAFRQYDGEDQQGAIVRNHYKAMRQNQCVEFVDRMWAKVRVHGGRPSGWRSARRVRAALTKRNCCAHGASARGHVHASPSFAKQWHTFDKAELTIREAFNELRDYADSSDPDTSLPNVVHAFQTAESARAAGEPDWLVLTALIHDMGKIMFKWGRPEDGQQVRGCTGCE